MGSSHEVGDIMLAASDMDEMPQNVRFVSKFDELWVTNGVVDEFGSRDHAGQSPL